LSEISEWLTPQAIFAGANPNKELRGALHRTPQPACQELSFGKRHIDGKYGKSRDLTVS
jgi:hypothetical protein